MYRLEGVQSDKMSEQRRLLLSWERLGECIYLYHVNIGSSNRVRYCKLRGSS